MAEPTQAAGDSSSVHQTRFELNTHWILTGAIKLTDLDVPLWTSAIEGDERVLCPYCTKSICRERDYSRHYDKAHRKAEETPPSPVFDQLVRGQPRQTRSGVRVAGRLPGNTGVDPSLAHPSAPVEPLPDLSPELGLSSTSEERKKNGSLGTAHFVAWTIVAPPALESLGFVAIADLKALVCTECQVCVPHDSVVGHLKAQHKHFVRAPAQTDLESVVERLGLNGSVESIIANVKSTQNFTTCALLRQEEGWWCEECWFATTSERSASEHQRKPGHSFTHIEVSLDSKNSKVPKKVTRGSVQTLFPVTRGGLIPSIGSAEIPSASASELFNQVTKLNTHAHKPPIIPQGDFRAIHPFIEYSGFGDFLGDRSWPEVQRLQELMKLDAQSIEWGPRVKSHCEMMMDVVSCLCGPRTYLARCLLNSAGDAIEPKPFRDPVSTETKRRYSTNWAKLITFIIRLHSVPTSDRCFGLTEAQNRQLIAYKEFLLDPETKKSDDHEGRAVEALTFLSTRLICHEMGDVTDALDVNHPIAVFTILHSVRPGNVVMDPVHISPFLASLEYYCRATILLQGHLLVLSKQEKSLYSAIQELRVWLQDGTDTPFAWLRQTARLSASFVQSSNRMPHFLLGKDSKTYTFDGYRIQTSDFFNMIKGAVQDAVNGFHSLCKMYGIPETCWITDLDSVHDVLAQRSANYNFARDPFNVKISDAEKEARNGAIDSGRFCRRVGDRLVWRIHSIKTALEASEEFLLTLAAALYLGSGQPPRGSELMATLLCNLDTRTRMIFVVNGRIVMCHFLNKTTFCLGSDKAIARQLCHAMSIILLNYIALVRPLEGHLYDQLPAKTSQNLQKTHQFLFHVGESELVTQSLTDQLKKTWRKYHPGITSPFRGFGTAESRQNMIYVCRRFIPTVALGSDGDAVFDLQAGHTSSVARSWYGIEGNRLGGNLGPDEMERFIAVSQAHEDLFKLHTVVATSSHAQPVLNQEDTTCDNRPSVNSLIPTRSGSLSGVPGAPPSDAPSARAFTTTPALFSTESTSSLQATLTSLNDESISNRLSTLFLQAMQPLVSQPLGSQGSFRLARKTSSLSIDPRLFQTMQLLVPHGRFRSPEQALAIQAVWQGWNHVMTILPTGGGKTLVAQVATHAGRESRRLDVLLVPLKALADDLQTRMAASGMLVARWRGSDTPDSQVLLCIFEDAGTEEWLIRIRTKLADRQLGRIIVDECHYPVYAGDFRGRMTCLRSLVMLGVQLLLLSATVPLSDTAQVLSFYGAPNATVVRAPTGRPNIAYVANKLPPRPEDHGEADFAVDQVCAAIRQYSRGGRVLVYVQSKELLQRMLVVRGKSKGQESAWVGYHADMPEAEKKSSLTQWKTVMAATKAIGLGFSPMDCDLVIHWEAPFSLLDYVQESGRAGRDGRSSSAVLLWSRIPGPPGEVDDPGRRAMEEVLDSPICRRQAIYTYMDGSSACCLALSAEYLLCDVCLGSIAAVTDRRGARMVGAQPLQLRTPLLPTEDVRAKLPLEYPISSTSGIASVASGDPDRDGRSVPEALPPTSFSHTQPSILPPDSTHVPLPSTSFTPTPILDYGNNRFLLAIGPLRGKCTSCYLQGLSLNRHRYQVFNCPEGKFQAGAFTAFSQWRDAFWGWPSGFAVRICTYCWLPEDTEYHSHAGNKHERCHYRDVLRPLALQAFGDQSVMQDFRRAHRDAVVNTQQEWAQWLQERTSWNMPRIHQFLIWLNDWLKSARASR